MSKNYHLNRIFHLNTVEAYFLRDGYLLPPQYCMVLIDYRRPSTIEDFPHLKSIEGISADEFGDDNFIKAVVVSSEEVDQETYDHLCTVAAGFLEDKDNCRWNFVVEVDADFLFKNNRNDIFSFLQKIVEKHGYPYNITNISEEKFNFLSQE